jgi:hypothetical protein
MIRGIDYITIEVLGLAQSSQVGLDECQEMLDNDDKFKNFKVEALNYRRDSGYIDVALYPKDGDKRKFIEDLKKIGL